MIATSLKAPHSHVDQVLLPPGPSSVFHPRTWSVCTWTKKEKKNRAGTVGTNFSFDSVLFTRRDWCTSAGQYPAAHISFWRPAVFFSGMNYSVRCLNFPPGWETYSCESLTDMGTNVTSRSLWINIKDETGLSPCVQQPLGPHRGLCPGSSPC